MSGLVAQYQQGAFTSPVNGTTADATVVLSNDNNVRTKHNSHDSDATIHVQSSSLASRPAAGTAQRVWVTTDGLKVYVDSGASWSEIAYLPSVSGVATGSRLIAATDISGAVAYGVYSDGNYSTTAEPAASLVSGLIVAKQTTVASGNNILLKTQYNQTVATTGDVMSIWATAMASHTSGTVNSMEGATIRAQAVGSGGTTTTLSALSVKTQVNAGATVGALNSIIILAPSVSGTVTGNTVGLSIGNIGSGNTQFAIFTGTGLVQLGDELIFAASTTSRPSMRIPSGTAPSSPTDGDFWYDGTNVKIRVGGTTKTFTLT